MDNREPERPKDDFSGTRERYFEDLRRMERECRDRFGISLPGPVRRDRFDDILHAIKFLAIVAAICYVAYLSARSHG